MKHKTNFETHTYDKNYIKQYQAILIQRMSSYPQRRTNKDLCLSLHFKKQDKSILRALCFNYDNHSTI